VSLSALLQALPVCGSGKHRLSHLLFSAFVVVRVAAMPHLNMPERYLTEYHCWLGPLFELRRFLGVVLRVRDASSHWVCGLALLNCLS
jgi:hypothetical protein